MKLHALALLLPCTALAVDAAKPSAKPLSPEEDRRRAAEIIEEARRRVGDWHPPEANDNRKDAPDPAKKGDPVKLYVTIGGDQKRIPLDFAALVEPLRSSQRNNTPLQYLEPMDDRAFNHMDALALSVGVRVNRWLDVELSRHGIYNRFAISGGTPVLDPEVPLDDKRVMSSQHTELSESSFTLTALPRWEPIKYVAVYGRLGVGYANNNLHSFLMTGKRIQNKELCFKDPATHRESCLRPQDVFHYQRYWSNVTQKEEGFFPVLGIGVELARYVRFEYQRRYAVPIGNDRVDLISEQYFSVRVFGEWDITDFGGRQ